jgi:hypothetical protein
MGRDIKGNFCSPSVRLLGRGTGRGPLEEQRGREGEGRRGKKGEGEERRGKKKVERGGGREEREKKEGRGKEREQEGGGKSRTRKVEFSQNLVHSRLAIVIGSFPPCKQLA